MVKWKKNGNDDSHVASLMLSSYQKYETAIASLYENNYVPYSGIVVSRDQLLTDGSRIEKSCYKKGGFKFIFRSYVETPISSLQIPVEEIVQLLQKIATLYVKEVIGIRAEKVYVQSCWAVCQRDGDYGTLHNHSSPVEHEGKLYSGMFYLRKPQGINPETFPDGCLHIITDDEVIYCPPVPGSIVFWPGKLVHGIHPFSGEGDRLGIAFNIIAVLKKSNS